MPDKPKEMYPPQLENDPAQNTYTVSLICVNCGHKRVGIIPKGVTVDAYCRQTRCGECGCGNTLRKRDNYG